MATKRKKDKGASGDNKKAKIEIETVDRTQYVDLCLDASPHAGELLFCGSTNWDLTGRKDLPKGVKSVGGLSLWEPYRLSTLENVKIRSVFSSCTACHCVAITTDGEVYTWGRNEKGQLGHGHCNRVDIPTIVEGLKDYNIVTAALGKAHTLFVTEKGDCYATGDNKLGQLGIGSENNNITSPTLIDYLAAPICKVNCGAEFSMFVSVDGKLYSAGLPEYGQLGHNTDGKYLAKANKIAYNVENRPRRVPLFIDKTKEGAIIPVPDVFVTDVACGVNHTIVLDKAGRVFTFGFGGYGRLGHAGPKDEMVPRIIVYFNGPNRGAIKIAAGAAFCLAVNKHGQLYLWGQNKPAGEANMYPKPVSDLNGWNVRSMGCSVRSIVVAADSSTIGWGPSPTNGELGDRYSKELQACVEIPDEKYWVCDISLEFFTTDIYILASVEKGFGNNSPKSSTRPLELKPLQDVYVQEVSCGFGHTLFIARTDQEGDEKAVEALPVHTPIGG